MRLSKKISTKPAILPNKVMAILYLLLSCNLIYISALAQVASSTKNINEYLLKQWNASTGFQGNGFLHIAQSADGYIWITGFKGLTKFDGYSFTFYNRKNTPELQSNGTNGIFADADTTVWFGTRESGLISYKKGKFTKHGGASFNIEFISRLDKDYLWIGTQSHGLYQYNSHNGQWKSASSELVLNTGITVISKNQKGDFYIGTESNGLIIYSKGTYTRYTTPPFNNISTVRAVLHLPNGESIIGTPNATYKIINNQVYPIPELTGVAVYSLIRDNKGDIWAGSTSGLWKKDETEPFFIKRTADIPQIHIQEVIADSDGSIWLATYRNGLYQLRDSKFTNITLGIGLGHLSTGSIGLLSNNRVLAGTTDGQLYELKDGMSSLIQTKSKLSESRLYYLMEDRSKNLWISTYDGLIRIDQNKTEKRYTTKDGLPENLIRTTYEDEKGNIWIGTRGKGISILSPDNKVTPFLYNFRFRGKAIMSISSDLSGGILIGILGGGVAHLNKKGDIRILNKSNGIKSAQVFNVRALDNKLWLLATGNGLSVALNNKIYNFDRDWKFPTDAIFDAILDNTGYIWMPSNEGIIGIHLDTILNNIDKEPRGLKWDQYVTTDGLISNDCSGATHSAITKDGTIFVPTQAGVIMIKPHSEAEKSRSLNPEIFSISIDSLDIYPQKALSLPPGVHKIIFRFNSVNFISPEKTEFRIKLEGFDKSWKVIRDKREETYTLNGGNYKFRVQTRPYDGEWNKNEAFLNLTIQKYFYETPWFLVTLALLLILVIYLAIQYRIHLARRNEARLMQLVASRTLELQRQTESLQHEINERLTIEKELIIARDKANQANKAKSEFLANMSHEIRTPMHGIMGMLELLQQTELNPEQTDYLDTIDNSAQNLLHIINDILDFSKIEAGQITINHIPFQLKTELSGVLRLQEINALKKNLSFTTYWDLPAEDWYLSDPARIRQIVMNLLNNAIKFTITGKIIVRIIHGFSTESSLRIEIEDTGIGISASDQEKLFKSFSQVDTTKTRVFGGTGLGLAISKRLVEMLGGTIGLVSKESEGSLFWFDIPLKKTDPPEVIPDPELNDSLEIQKGSKLNILLAEDHLVNQKVALALLSREGHNVTIARNGLEAFELFTNNHYDLVLMDISMPEWDGMQATRAIRNWEKRQLSHTHTRIIALTANALNEDRIRCLEAGMDDYISKPFKIEELSKILRNVKEN